MNYTQNRELSWLKFNERVLEEANNPNVPIYERLKFLDIFTSNMDEFYMVRVGSLINIDMENGNYTDSKTGLSANEQLKLIYQETEKLYIKKDETYKNLSILLEKENIKFCTIKDLKETEMKNLKKIFKNEILPMLSAQIIDFNHPFPHLENKACYIIAQIKGKHIGLIPVNGFQDQIIKVSPGKWVRLERLIYDFAEIVFKGFSILNKNMICVTRNADIDFDDIENEDFDFRQVMKGLLKQRKKLSVVRLEVHKPLIDEFKNLLYTKLNIDDKSCFVTKTPCRLKFIYSLIEQEDRKGWLYPRLIHTQNTFIDTKKSITENVLNHDVLAFYPYNSMVPFLNLIKEASISKNVTAIYITIYRLSQKSKLVDYLCNAAEAGIEVNVLIELRARFDEKNNIDFSERLEDSGCKIMYGFDEYKVHSKICLIVKKNNNKISYITQIGTGNYNEKTVNIYTDYSLMTANPLIGCDAHLFFKNMMLGSLENNYEYLLVSPNGLKPKIISYIEREKTKKENGYIFIKCNSITDIDIINKLTEASMAGTKIDLVVRGICCILPGKLETMNISIKSIVGRFLEHSRIYLFGKENPDLYIASADMMTRNTDKRVEVATPILDTKVAQSIFDHIKLMLKDNQNGRVLTSNGNYIKIDNNDLYIDCQKEFLDTEPIHSKVRTKSLKSKLLEKMEKDNIKFELNSILDLGFKKIKLDFKIGNVYYKVMSTKRVSSSFIANQIITREILKKNNEKIYIIFKELDDESQMKLNQFQIKFYLQTELLEETMKGSEKNV